MVPSLTRTFSARGARRWPGALAAVAVLAAAAPSPAAPLQFATFDEAGGTRLTWTSSGSTGHLSAASTPVTFNFLVPTSGGPVGPTAAVMSVDVATTQAGFAVGPMTDQGINQPTSEIRITDPTATHNYLTLFLTGDLSGFTNDSIAHLTGSSDAPRFNVVSYSSDYLSFAPGGSYAINLPNITNTDGGTGLQLAGSGFLGGFTSDAQGSFQANIIPAGVPAPTSLAMLGTGVLAPLGLILARRRRRRTNPPA
jgi:hypothetical protein